MHLLKTHLKSGGLKQRTITWGTPP